MTQDEIIRMARERFDYNDGNLVWKSNRGGTARAGSLAGYMTDRGYIEVNLSGKKIKAHRLIYLLHYGYMPNEIDHADGNKSNNRIENLREATRSQNQHNQTARKNNTSGVKGVVWNKAKQKWDAQITVNRKKLNLGRYDSLDAAMAAVVIARNEHHGEFANHG